MFDGGGPATCLHIDAELPAEDITFELVKELQELEPFGAGNPRPVFMTHNLRIMSEPRLIGEKHLKMHVGGPEGRSPWRQFGVMGPKQNKRLR